MKTTNNIYVAPQVEIIEIDIEDAVLALSGEYDSYFSTDDLTSSTGRF